MAESTDPVTATKTPKELIKRFYSQQEKRVETYDLFEEGFRTYLDSAPNYDFPLYRQLVNAVTNTFQSISREIICIKTELNDSHNMKELASLVDKVQDKEKSKLELTVNLQLSEKDVKDNEGVESYVDKVRELKERMKGLQEEISEVLEEIKYESEDLYEDDRVER
ncbi:hypothetical protein CHS0354_026463 [Potamilus streckersoni]|uniref:Uncharacterized protein n=1 Tax=Potamilus streckersoni TaxID=2493646 RepID=A0AAE0RPU2_9BIVA|nr:hypothetical protein CHS0354_026463 [Potamilus streckersoni]